MIRHVGHASGRQQVVNGYCAPLGNAVDVGESISLGAPTAPEARVSECHRRAKNLCDTLEGYTGRGNPLRLTGCTFTTDDASDAHPVAIATVWHNGETRLRTPRHRLDGAISLSVACQNAIVGLWAGERHASAL